MTPATHVTVYAADTTIHTFSRCNVDILETDTLTVTTCDDEREIRAFRPGTWIDATVRDDRGNLMYHFKAGLR